MLENKLLNDESLELNVVISQKNLQVSTHCIRNDKMNESERKTSKLTVCISPNSLQPFYLLLCFNSVSSFGFSLQTVLRYVGCIV